MGHILHQIETKDAMLSSSKIFDVKTEVSRTEWYSGQNSANTFILMRTNLNPCQNRNDCASTQTHTHNASDKILVRV